MTDRIDPRRFVSHEGDLEEAARDYAASQKTDGAKAKEKLYSGPGDEPLASTQDRTKTASGVSYAELAKNAQKQPAPACDSMHTESCPVDGWVTTFSPHAGRGGIGFDVALSKKEGDDITTLARAHAQVGLQNEVVIAGPEHDEVELVEGGIRWSARHDGPRLEAHAGVLNADGSTGLNLGSGAQLQSGTVAAQRAEDGSGWDVSGAVGVSDDVAVGVKRGADGTRLLCIQVDASFVTLHTNLPVPR